MATTDLKSENGFLEAPVSWNTRYLSPEGFVCQITLRGDTGRDLLEKAKVALAFLQEQGCRPCENNNNNHHSNGNGNHHASDDPVICSIHKVPMKRYEKDGRSWFSHRLEDGSWCHGKKQNAGGQS